jgi:hypothetical protein
MNIFEAISSLNFLVFDLNKLCITFWVGFSHKVCFLPLCDNSNLIFLISLKKIWNKIVLFHICLNPKNFPPIESKIFLIIHELSTNFVI